VPIINLPVASTSAKGVVQLGSSSDTTAGLVVQTNDSRLSDSRATSSVNFGTATLTGVVPNINLPNLVTSLNGLNNNVVLVPGSNITIAPSGQNLTIAAASTFVNTIVVHRVGTPAQNGQALLDALAGITTASANNPFLLKIEPGTYDLGTQSLNMKQFVDIEGSGQLSTTITASGRAVAFSGTISGTDNAEIRSLTVTNTGGNSFAAGIVNFGASPQITDVRVIVSGGTDSQFGNLGIHNVFGGQATITDVKVSVFSNSGSAGCVGILNAGTSPTMNNVSVNMSSGLTGSATGVYNSSNAQPVINNLTVNISGGTGAFNAGILNSGTASPSVTSSSITVLGSSGSTNYGVRNLANSSPMLSGITLDVSGGNVSVDVSSDSSSPMVNNMTASAHGASNANQCIACTNNSACQVGQSRCNVTGTGTSVDCDDCNSNSTCEISHSHLSCTTVTMQECDGVANSSSNLILQNSDVMTSGNGTNKGVVNMANAGNFTIIIKNSSIMGMAAIDSTACAGCTSNVTNSELDGAVAGGTNNCGGAFTSNALPRNNICQ